MSKYSNRKHTHIDMTPFVDIAFLILTFFILVTNFKPEETIKITPPKSVSMEEIKEIPNSVTILFDSSNNVFVMLSKELRDPFLVKFNEKYGIQLTPSASKEFNKAGQISTPLVGLNNFYSLPTNLRNKNNTSLDMSAEKQDLFEVVSMVKEISENSMQVYLKGDNIAKYTIYKKILKSLTDNNIHNFNLITTSEPISPATPLGMKLSSFNKSKNK